MATSKNSPSLSPLVVFLLGAASATVLLLFFLTSTARPAWPALETGPHSGSTSVRCSTPRANGTVVAAEQHTGGVRAPPANKVMRCFIVLGPEQSVCMLGRSSMVN
jgi:hypothetical protein